MTQFKRLHTSEQVPRSAFSAVFVFALGLFTATGCLEVAAQPDAGQPDAGHTISQALIACAADAGTAPTSVASVVDRMNALPRPVDGPCLVASLPRPLSLVGTVGKVSAQPAGGANDPRVFILNQGVVIAVVSAGEGAKAIELGEWVSDTQTLKAEILLPVTDTLSQEQPFTHITLNGGTTTICAMCHRPETPNPTVGHGFDSAAYRPLPADEVKLPALEALHQKCVAAGEVSARCDMFHALFDFGEVTQGSFSTNIAYFNK